MAYNFAIYLFISIFVMLFIGYYYKVNRQYKAARDEWPVAFYIALCLYNQLKSYLVYNYNMGLIYHK